MFLGFDQHTNVILDQAYEREYTENGARNIAIGLFTFRGDDMYQHIAFLSFTTSLVLLIFICSLFFILYFIL